MAIKKILSFILIAVIAISVVRPQAAYAEDTQNESASNQIETIVIDLINWKKENLGDTINDSMFSESFLSQAGTTGDWYTIGLARLGYEDDFSSYLDAVSINVSQRYERPEKLDKVKSTEWHRISLGILACGSDPTSVKDLNSNQTINLIADGTYNRGKDESFDAQGLNAWIYGLIALDSMRYEVPTDAYNTRDDFISTILKHQLADGGFGSKPSDSSSSVDFTSMAICALAPYYNSEQIYVIQTSEGEETSTSVRQAIDEAINRLSEIQTGEGDFGNTESTTAVITALSILGIDPLSDSRFIKNDKTILDGLLKYRQTDGGFTHTLEEDGQNQISSNSMTGSTVLYSLVSLMRFQGNFRTLYDFRPEIDPSLKANITQLMADINTLPDDLEQTNEDKVKEIFATYLQIPVSERSYVYNYYRLADAMDSLNINNTSEYLSEHMDINVSGDGTVTKILSSQQNTTLGKELQSSNKILYIGIACIVVLLLTIVLFRARKQRMRKLISMYSNSNTKTKENK